MRHNRGKVYGNASIATNENIYVVICVIVGNTSSYQLRDICATELVDFALKTIFSFLIKFCKDQI